MCDESSRFWILRQIVRVRNGVVGRIVCVVVICVIGILQYFVSSDPLTGRDKHEENPIAIFEIGAVYTSEFIHVKIAVIRDRRGGKV